jgi:hypothetical protein
VKCPAVTFRVNLGHTQCPRLSSVRHVANVLRMFREGSDWGQCPVGRVGFEVPPFTARVNS